MHSESPLYFSAPISMFRVSERSPILTFNMRNLSRSIQCYWAQLTPCQVTTERLHGHGESHGAKNPPRDWLLHWLQPVWQGECLSAAPPCQDEWGASVSTWVSEWVSGVGGGAWWGRGGCSLSGLYWRRGCGTGGRRGARVVNCGNEMRSGGWGVGQRGRGRESASW